jgi:thioredoxin-related protein
VKWFCDKHKVPYNVLLNGKEIVQQYGVSVFPSFFVIDKVGKIIYAVAGYDESVEKQIEGVISNAW